MIAIITDSTAGFTRYEALNDNIIILPMYFTNKDYEFSEVYLDEAEDYIKSSDVLSCKTAGTNVADFYRAFSTLKNAGHQIICITISSRFSSAFVNANTAKKMLELNNEDIAIIDSRSTAGGLYLLVKEAVNAVKSGDEFEDIVDQLNIAREKTGVVFSVDDMSALRKSGRIGIVSQSVGTILNTRPILVCKNGTIVFHGMVRGTSAQIKGLVNYVPENAKHIIVHAKNDNPKLKTLSASIKNRFENINVMSISNVLTVHLGYDVVGIAWMVE